jgi:hypothetical protein
MQDHDTLLRRNKASLDTSLVRALVDLGLLDHGQRRNRGGLLGRELYLPSEPTICEEQEIYLTLLPGSSEILPFIRPIR